MKKKYCFLLGVFFVVIENFAFDVSPFQGVVVALLEHVLEIHETVKVHLFIC